MGQNVLYLKSFEEKEAKKKKMSENFMKFFKKSDKQAESAPPSTPFSVFENALFKPFEVKDGMSLAPIFVREPLLPEIYENLLNIQDEVDALDHFHFIMLFLEKSLSCKFAQAKMCKKVIFTNLIFAQFK